MKFDKYDLDSYLFPIWTGDTVCNETVLFVGKEDSAPLIYTPSKILSVRNYGLDIEYIEGKDYIVKGKNIIRTPNSSMPFLEIDEYYKKTPDDLAIEVVNSLGGYKFNEQRYMKFGETDTFTRYQIAVSYTHLDAWGSEVPKGQSDKSKKALEKLKKGEPFTLVFFGDSIVTGCNSSGTSVGGLVKPFAESFPVMITKYLEKTFSTKINYVNTAVGGMDTAWGVKTFKENVLDKKPDLLIMGFGMNDGDTDPLKYIQMQTEMVNMFHNALPNSEIILIASTLPNIETNWVKNQGKFLEHLQKLCKKYSFVSLADMTTMHQSLFSCGKRYRDISANNVNHPNDFVARIYAQVILKTLLAQD